jgi:hypothetical protein
VCRLVLALPLALVVASIFDFVCAVIEMLQVFVPV